MPLAKFLYGETHKWFFRAAAAVVVASYVTAVAAHFDYMHRWILYFIAFGAVTAVYWLLYAPAKWVQADNLQRQADSTNRNNRTKLIWDLGGGEYQLDDVLHHHRVQRTLHNGNVPAQPPVPAELRVLHYYLLDEGKWSERGPYGHTKQWTPPGFWRGNKEFRTFRDAIHREIAASKADFSGVISTGVPNREERLYQLSELTKAMLYLDKHSPKWRKKAQMWADGGRARIALRQLRASP